MMGRKVAELLHNIVEMATKNAGLALVEVWECDKCGMECVRIHPMLEVIACGNCGQRRASKLPRYLSVCDLAADAEKAPGKLNE